jgi:hypothetical protein
MGHWRWTRYVAAASVLIVFGFLAGRAFNPSIDVDRLQKQWVATVQPQMEANITSSVVKTLRPEIVNEYAAMQDALSDQINVQLTAYAEQTIMRNDLQTYRLLTELIEAIESAQVQNQQWALTAMAELESQRLKDQQAVQNQVAVLAAYTDNEFSRTQKAIQALSIEKN